MEKPRSEAETQRYIDADKQVGDRIIWRPCQQSNHPEPIHKGTVMAIAGGDWIQVREDSCWGRKWMNLNEINLCEKILAERKFW